MSRNQKQQYQLKQIQQAQDTTKRAASTIHQITEDALSDIPVIRNSTPRPHSFDAMVSYTGYFQSLQPSASAFPERAPTAPPLPEELIERDQEQTLSIDVAIPPTPQLMLAEGQQKFLWLFEYGLEMDPALLNSYEQLNGCALLYGPALLKGYTLVFGIRHAQEQPGQSTVAIIPSIDADAEVWGVVYRIPQHLALSTDKQPSLLDSIHTAVSPHNLFQSVSVIVHEIYGDQEIPAMAYVATSMACQELELTSPAQASVDAQFVQRLSAIARGHKLPQSYIAQYSTKHYNSVPLANSDINQQIQEKRQEMRNIPLTQIPPSILPPSHVVAEPSQSLALTEQRTDPLPTVKRSPHVKALPVQQAPTTLSSPWSLSIFSVYLVVLFCLTVTFAIVQSMGFVPKLLTNDFTLLGIPWLVVLYGLLGGCVSGLITQGRLRSAHPPLFVIITWFVRPYIGAVLAMFAYILLTSGLFMVGQSLQRHTAFFWLVGALAGFCEGWAFRYHTTLQHEY